MLGREWATGNEALMTADNIFSFAGVTHKRHIHISFTKLGDKDSKPFDIPLLGGKI